MATCAGCRQPIDPAFDSTARDRHGRTWHAPCLARQGSLWIEVVILLVCWPWGLARVIGRSRGWRSSTSNLVGAAATVAVVLLAIAL